MAIGATILFFPYTFAEGDLSRYQFAKERWLKEGMSEKYVSFIIIL